LSLLDERRATGCEWMEEVGVEKAIPPAPFAKEEYDLIQMFNGLRNEIVLL